MKITTKTITTDIGLYFEIHGEKLKTTYRPLNVAAAAMCISITTFQHLH